METPSDRVLASWREHAREGWYFEKHRHYRARWVPYQPPAHTVNDAESYTIYDLEQTEMLQEKINNTHRLMGLAAKYMAYPPDWMRV